MINIYIYVTPNGLYKMDSFPVSPVLHINRYLDCFSQTLEEESQAR